MFTCASKYKIVNHGKLNRNYIQVEQQSCQRTTYARMKIENINTDDSTYIVIQHGSDISNNENSAFTSRIYGLNYLKCHYCELRNYDHHQKSAKRNRCGQIGHGIILPLSICKCTMALKI